MKLIVKHYLNSLKERDELDAVLTNLLSQMGLNVISRPGRGTRQEGVDIAAIGSIGDGPEKVYLLSVKSGDLNRNTWSSNSPQSLRPSLEQILDAYIPNRIPQEHKDKDIVICLCLGGDIQEQVRENVTGFTSKNSNKKVTFEEWNGDKIASFILEYFLRADLLAENARSELQKSLALLDEPESSFSHFTSLVNSIFEGKNKNKKRVLISLRQLSLCLWILFSWSRDVDNLESAYLSSELSLLRAWELLKPYLNKKSKRNEEIQQAFLSVLIVYMQIINAYVNGKILPYVNIKHALSSAVHAPSGLDVNLKMFDILGRISISGIWLYYQLYQYEDVEQNLHESFINEINIYFDSIKKLIINNPALLSPIKDDQVIDISIAIYFLRLGENNDEFIMSWLGRIVESSRFAFLTNGKYPCNLSKYEDLLDHPREGEEYREEVNAGSVLYPMIAFWSSLIGDKTIYARVQEIKHNYLQHSNFQLWYPSEDSEDNYFTNKQPHGAVLSHVGIDNTPEKYLEQIFNECKKSPYFESLSSVERGFWPLILVASRCYRYPVPIFFWKSENGQ